MKRTIARALAALSLAALLASCTTPVDPVAPVAPVPFDLDAASLMGQTFTYMIAGDGHGKAAFKFAADGLSGSFDITMYNYGYADAAAAALATYTAKTWFQDSGSKGTFTYDPKTYDFTMTPTFIYGKKAGATTEYAADYEYQDVATAASTRDKVAYSAYTMTEETKVIFNMDNVSLFSAMGEGSSKAASGSRAMREEGLGLYFGSGPAWSAPYASITTSVLDGVTTARRHERTNSITISTTSIVSATKYVETTIVGSAAPVTSTNSYTSTYAVDATYLVGDTKEGQSFDDMWKNDNTVSFVLTRTQREDISYTGATAPTAPTVFDSNGIGVTNTTEGTYRIYKSPGESQMSFVKKEGYIASPSFFGSASRGE